MKFLFVVIALLLCEEAWAASPPDKTLCRIQLKRIMRELPPTPLRIEMGDNVLYYYYDAKEQKLTLVRTEAANEKIADSLFRAMRNRHTEAVQVVFSNGLVKQLKVNRER